MITVPFNGKTALFLNGNARSVKSNLAKIYEKKYGDRITIFNSKCIEQGKEIAQKIVEGKFGLVVPCGGDGTLYGLWNSINDVLEKLDSSEQHPIYAPKKYGTGNAIADEVGGNNNPGQLENILTSTQLPIKQLSLIQAKVEKQDKETETSYFSFMGVGWDALILNRFNAIKKRTKGKLPGLLDYSLGAVAAFVSVLLGKKTDVDVQALTENVYRMNEDGTVTDVRIARGESFSRDNINIAGVATHPYLGFKFKSFPQAELAEERGLMALTLIAGPPRRTGAKLFTSWHKLWNGKLHNDSMNYLLTDAIKMTYTGNGSGTEGEIAGDDLGKILSMECRKTNRKMNLLNYFEVQSA